MTATYRQLRSQMTGLMPGLTTALVIAAAATFLSEHYSAPVMLFALLLGMALNHLGESARASLGLEFAAKNVLRVGVALLGARISAEQVIALGWQPLLLIVVAVVATILVSVLLARWMGFSPLFGLLSGGATAICGASAALALAAALPSHPKKEQATSFTVIGVSALSTLAMILYPAIASLAGLSAHQSGIFIGATIHDVAQVVGAGYAISIDAGDTATIVKLTRVAMLLPVILVAGQIARRASTAEAGARPPLLPGFVIAFVVLVAVNSTGWVPEVMTDFAAGLSRWCLVTAIAAIGIRANLRELAAVGLRPVLLMVGETVFLAGLVLAALTVS